MHEHNNNISSKEDKIVLLKYMVNHNKSHTSELGKINKKINSTKINKAIELYNQANLYLEEALTEMEE